MKGHWSWIIATFIAIPLMICIFVFGWDISDNIAERYLTIVIFIASGSIGWFVGMILSPDSLSEEKRFSTFSKNISLFISGYMVSKIDRLVDALFQPDIIFSSNRLAGYRFVGALSMLILAALLTYLLRVYAFTIGDD